MAHPSVSDKELAEFVRLGEIPYMQQKRQLAIDYISEHPGQYLVMSLRRFVYMWTAFWNLDPANLEIEFHNPANVYLTVSMTVVMLIGLWQALRNARRAALPYLLLLLFYPLVFYLTHPEIRYRHIVEPQIIILAALGLKFMVSELLRNFPQLARLVRRTV
jgi:hypothetical protein